MLSYNERGIRKLQENFACFHDKLAEEDVYQSFLAIVGKSKKFAKPEVKVDQGFVVLKMQLYLLIETDRSPLRLFRSRAYHYGRLSIVVLIVDGKLTFTKQ